MSVLADATVVRHLHRVPEPDPVEADPGRLRDTAVQVRADLGRWWLTTANPPDLTTWLAAHQPARIPEDNIWLRAAWRVDHWTTGTLLAGLSTALFLAAAGLRWVACHPARRWVALLIAAAGGTYLWLA